MMKGGIVSGEKQGDRTQVGVPEFGSRAQSRTAFRKCLENRLASMISIAELMNDDVTVAERIVAESAIEAYNESGNTVSSDDCAVHLSTALVRRLLADTSDLREAVMRTATMRLDEANSGASLGGALSALDAEVIISDADRSTVREAFRRLPEPERLVLALVMSGNHTTAELSRILDMQRDMIRSLRIRAQQCLQRELAGLIRAGT
jgi:ribosomal protein S6